MTLKLQAAQNRLKHKLRCDFIDLVWKRHFALEEGDKDNAKIYLVKMTFINDILKYMHMPAIKMKVSYDQGLKQLILKEHIGWTDVGKEPRVHRRKPK